MAGLLFFAVAAVALAGPGRAALPGSGRGANLASLPEGTPTCPGTEAVEAISVTVDEYTLKAKFACSATLTGLLPNYTANTPLTTCHLQKDCADTASAISQALKIKNGELIKGTEPANDYTLSLSSMPSDRDREIYYRCRTGDNAKNCTVTIKLPTAPASNSCTLSKTVELKVEQAGTYAEFLCPSSTSLEPGSGNVYKAPDGLAADALTNVIPGAELEVDDNTKRYKLHVPTLPSTRQTVYFKCVYTKPAGYDESLGSSDCLVKIAINAAASGGNTSSTTQTTTAGSSGVAPAFAGLALTTAFIANTVGVY